MDDGRYANSLRAWGDRVAKKGREYRLDAIGETQLIDLAGQLRSTEKRLADLRLEISSEFGDTDTSGSSVAEGRRWKAKTSRVGQRSYNPSAIFTSAQAEGYTMMDLVRSGALKLTWGWQKLEAFFAINNIPMRTVGHELDPDVNDPEGPHVGVWYKTGSTSYEPLNEG